MKPATADKKKPAGINPAGSLDDALCYLSLRDFRVFPLLPGSKLPKVSRWTEPGRWHAFGPEDNVGIFTGYYLGTEALIASGRVEDPVVKPLALLAVDVDMKNGKNGEATLATWQESVGVALPPTLEHRTPTGGRHLIYWVRDAVKGGVNVLGEGVDIRSAGNYIVAPGSKTEDGEYTVLRDRPIAEAPAALIDACGQPRERIERPDEVALTGYAAEVAHSKAVGYLTDDAPAAVQGAGGDETAYKVAARVRDFGLTQAECVRLMDEHWNERCQPPWSMTELETKVRNAYEYAKGEAGADNPAVVFEPVPAGDKASAPAQHTTFRIVSAGDVLDEPDTEWLLEGLMPACGLGVIYGEPGTGKSFLALDIAAAIACGSAWGECRVRRPGPVVYVGLEGRQKLRVEAYMKHHGRDRATMRDLRIVQGQPLDLSHPKGEPAAILARDIKEVVPGARAVFVDTLSRALHGGDENSSEYMGRAVAAADQLGKHLGCLVILVHHSGKDSKKGARGHSLLHGATDVELEVTRKGEAREVKAAKVKDGEDGLRWEFRLRPVGLGVTADGATRSSCIIENLQPVRGSSRPLTAIQAAVLEALRRATDAKMGKATKGADGFAEVSLSREEWRAAYYEAEGGDTKKRRQLKSRFDDASRALVAQDRVQSCGHDRYALAA